MKSSSQHKKRASATPPRRTARTTANELSAFKPQPTQTPTEGADIAAAERAVLRDRRHSGFLARVTDTLSGESPGPNVLPEFVADVIAELSVLQLALLAGGDVAIDFDHLCTVLVGMRRRCEFALELHRRGAA